MRRESLAASAAANAGIPAPLGTVTLAFTDIQSSTSLWEHLGEMKMKELLGWWLETRVGKYGWKVWLKSVVGKYTATTSYCSSHLLLLVCRRSTHTPRHKLPLPPTTCLPPHATRSSLLPAPHHPQIYTMSSCGTSSRSTKDTK